ncbi:hypothetical protein CCACVL1_19605 [Corchorus capsularis]|uniref:Uncharacterized protein n=1 Tax=Corchorus capsularis TaxID=210143 RepID=A0A1R3HFX9_COCAP|nr:hypothetical protein CCACVL1_19605 [Corchorus capsularis]
MEELMDSNSPKPFVAWGLSRPANNKFEPKDLLIGSEEGNGNVSSESSHSCGNYKGMEILYSDDDEVVAFGDKSLSSEPRNVSLGLGFSEKGTRVFEQGEC